MKYKMALDLYNILSYDWASVNYIRKELLMTYQHVWNCMKFLKALDLLMEKTSPVDQSVSIFKLKPLTFNEFLEKVNK